ncbi:MAG: DUF1572 family protein [Ferruginibacter sp.]
MFKFVIEKMTAMNTNNVYLRNAKSEFLRYKSLGDKSIEQLEPGQLFFANNDDSNSIAVIVKHMHGNMISRWTNFLTTDGEKPWRKRDAEFKNTINDKQEVLKQWEEGWACLFAAIDPLSDEQLSTIVYIRNEAHTVMEAINRQLTHYAYHVGQIVFVAKQLKKGEWNTLSIAKNKSKEFNAKM